MYVNYPKDCVVECFVKVEVQRSLPVRRPSRAGPQKLSKKKKKYKPLFAAINTKPIEYVNFSTISKLIERKIYKIKYISPPRQYKKNSSNVPDAMENSCRSAILKRLRITGVVYGSYP